MSTNKIKWINYYKIGKSSPGPAYDVRGTDYFTYTKVKYLSY